MKIIILAGGLGTRISEETSDKPKPMVQINGKPILWHLMNTFAEQGFTDFALALGYKSEVVVDWLGRLKGVKNGNRKGDLVTNFEANDICPWNIDAIETGLSTQTGGRIAQCMGFYPGERVMATYGDGLANVSIPKLLQFHDDHGKLSTVTAVRPPARFGYLQISDSKVIHFGEKNQSDAGWINGGYFVLEPTVAEFVSSNDEPFEAGALPRLVEDSQLMAYHHYGFWQPMDTLREKHELEKFANSSQPPWLNLENDLDY
jgi:glucose-1-phosphate cytidylyltransferase